VNDREILHAPVTFLASQPYLNAESALNGVCFSAVRGLLGSDLIAVSLMKV